MANTQTLALINDPGMTPRPTPVSMNTDWFPMIDATAMDDVTSDLQNVEAETSSLIHEIDIRSMGGFVALSCGYSRAATSVTTNAIVILFGKDINEQWMRLQLADGNYDCTLTIADTTDADDGAVFQWTSVDIKTGTTVYDCAGCIAIKALVKTVLATNGDDTIGVLRGKMLN